LALPDFEIQHGVEFGQALLDDALVGRRLRDISFHAATVPEGP